MAAEQLVGRTASELASAVRTGEVRAVDVVRAHLDHLDAVEGHLGATVATRHTSALSEAEALDAAPGRAELPLAGVPVVIKDVADVAGEATRHGSRATSPDPVEEDEPVVARLRAAGAIVLAKTRCPELSLWGTSDDPEGIAVNPWDPTRTAGGSSGGSAAAVAAGVAPLALASDGLGSVRIPAAATGTFGIKPGDDLAAVLLDGEHHWFGMSRYGPIATTVSDAALMLDVMAGRSQLRDVTEAARPWRIAVSWAAPGPGIAVTRPWIDAALETGRLLRSTGHDVRHVDPPYDPMLVPAVLSRWVQGAARDVELLGLDEAALQPRTHTHVRLGRRLQRRAPVTPEPRRRWRERVVPFLEEHDVLVMPALARMPLRAEPWHRASWFANAAANLSAYPMTSAWNLADVPAASVPMWQHRGRPLAVQLVAAPGREDRVLAVARELERLRPWTRHAPGWGVPSVVGAQPGA